MARADRRRDARARPAPEPGFHRKYESAYVGTEDLFFQRLRRRAKWIFVFLALTFAVSFVAFGVGSEVQGGIADYTAHLAARLLERDIQPAVLISRIYAEKRRGRAATGQ